MGNFIGKLKAKKSFNKIFEKHEELTKIIEDNQIFFNLAPKINEAIDFKQNPEYKLESDNFFFVEYSSTNEDIKNTIQSYYDVISSTAEISTLDRSSLVNIEFLFYGKKIDDNMKLNLQSITPKFFIKSTSFLKFDKQIVYHHEKDILEFKDDFNIHIDERSKKIYFKNFFDLRKFHKDFIELYKEATGIEKNTFIEEVNKCDFFKIDNSKLELGSTNLKKLKYILDNKILEIVFKDEKKVTKYIKRYKTSLSLTKEKNKYIIKNNKDFTNLLKVINENFYQGEITGKKLESNSTKVLEIKND